ncbi:MAG: DUF4132 domain-containing protein, partial [Clostridiales bacterium]|nr:DUF4132 domain-containing protein [Clostridiales bacterium]
ALWSVGFTDIAEAGKRAEELMLEGNREQQLTAAYFLAHTDIPYRRTATMLRIFETKPDDFEIQALLMPAFLINMSLAINLAIAIRNDYSIIKGFVKSRVFANYDYYFSSIEEARRTYDILSSIVENLPKKKITYEGLVFPWSSVSFGKADYYTRMAYCASACMDKNLTRFVASHLADIDTETRGKALRLLLNEPENKEEYEYLTKALSDNETYTRKAAAEMLKHELERDTSFLDESIAAEEGKLPSFCYSILEDALRLKKADVRSEAIALLMTMDEKEKVGLVSRLLSDSSEEKRSAGLDILLQMKKEESPTFPEAMEIARSMEKPSTKEQILLDQILGGDGTAGAEEDGAGEFYDKNATYEPVLDPEYTKECMEVFLRIFPNSCFAKKKLFGKKFEGREKEVLKKLDDLIEAHRDDEYVSFGEKHLLGNGLQVSYVPGAVFPFAELWEEFYEKEVKDPDVIIRADYMANAVSYRSLVEKGKPYSEFVDKHIALYFGKEMLSWDEGDYRHATSIKRILPHLLKYVKRDDIAKASCALAYQLTISKEDLLFYSPVDPKVGKAPVTGKNKCETTFMNHAAFRFFTGYLRCGKKSFSYHYALARKFDFEYGRDSRYVYYDTELLHDGGPVIGEYIAACARGIISKDFLYKTMMDKNYIAKALQTITGAVLLQREASDADVGSRFQTRFYRMNNEVNEMLGRRYNSQISQEDLSDEERKILDLAVECYETIVPYVLNVELKRGDSPTVFSPYIKEMKRIYGVRNFVAILSAMGKDSFNRSKYMSYTSKIVSKPDAMSYLLGICIPDNKDGDVKTQAKLLGELLKGTDIKEKRLIEASLFSPEWIPILSEHLGWEGFTSGCYYFIAHMNENFDDRRKATIAKYSPIDDESFRQGAFDKAWFDEVYEILGKKRFDEIYDAAKYISDGAKHSRARKYADAAIGKLNAEEVHAEIVKKRNKDLLMAYGIIPGNEKELQKRYTYIRQFMKEARGYGALRRASETQAGEMAIKNMATAEGYQDETRFILKMENNIAGELAGFWNPAKVEDVEVCLKVNDGKVEISTTKDGKALKSLPARLKKNEYIEDLQEAKKAFTEQYRRTKIMLEEAMESRSAFAKEEIDGMNRNPVLAPLMQTLVFESEDGVFGLLDELTMKDGSMWYVAHPFSMYKAGIWRDIQKKIFEREIVQPFKQVFRELYVKTEEEKEMFHSTRYAGNQIQVKRTLALLKTRRWMPDEETGVQKVYYKENIIATIFALADWFSPSDIEAPTLEYVVFFDRKTFKEIKIADVPDILFSEVMRDVDLVVSVAHAGEVDPEMSHSTIEMRHAIAEFTCMSFGLKNVTFTESHALIEGKRASYTVHLGSGVIHQKGGTMINVLPVHSQRRGRIFLPFIDDDPKTSEILTKILFFAEDQKIKDPFILSQILS